MKMQQSDNRQKEQKQQLFLLSDHKKFIINPPVDKILGFCPMFNNTAVIVAIKSHRRESIAHINQQGKILKELIYEDSNFLYSYAFPSDREIIWMDVDRNLIMQWNLQTYKLVECPFLFLGQAADTEEIFYFSATKLICIGEWGRHDNNEFRLSYFSYPLQSTSQKLFQFQSRQVWNYDYKVTKGNQKSMFLWYRACQNNKLSFRKFELLQDAYGSKEGVFKQYSVEINSQQIVRGRSLNFCILKMWEMVPKKYMITLFLEKSIGQEEQNTNTLFVYSQEDQLFRKATFNLEDKYRFQIIDAFHFGKTSIIKTFDFKEGKSLISPVYYIDNKNQRIFARSKWKCSNLNKYTFPGYDPNMIVDAQYENGDVKEINSYENKVVEPLQITTNFLQSIIPQIDRDLIETVLGLIYDM